MKNLAFMKTLSRSFSRAKFQIIKHSPEILIAAGVVGTVTSAVMACRATTKLGEVIETAKDDIFLIHQEAMNADETTSEEVVDTKKDLAIVYAKTGLELVKLYAPSVALGALSLTGMISSNRILKKRNAALAAAYVTIDRSFKEYRNRVSERFGADVENEIRYNIKEKKFEETTIDEKGKEKKVKVTKNIADLTACSDWAMYYDSTTSYAFHDGDDDYNHFYLRGVQASLDSRLKCSETGYLFLHEAYEQLQIKMTPEMAKAAQVVGWVYDKNNPIGDNCVDLRVRDVYREVSEGKYEKAIILDFNVDGNVWELMPSK